MPRNLTASDRKSLIRLASTLPKGSPQRKAILAGLKKTSGYADHTYDGELLQAVQSAGWRNHSWGEVGGSGFSLRNAPSLSKRVKLPNGIEFEIFLAFGKGRLWIGMDPETGISDADILPYEVEGPNAPQLQRLDIQYFSLGEKAPSGFESGEDYAFNGWVLIPTGSPERDLKRAISAFKKYANAVARIYMAFDPMA